MKIISRGITIIVISIAALLILVVGLFGHRDMPLDVLKEKYAQSPSEFISVEGMMVHYRDEGNPQDSLPIVLLHGTGASLHTFDAWTATLTSQYRVVRLDLPAFGLTGPFLHQNYSIEKYVEFVDQFLQAKGIQQCIIGGNSLGGEIAWRYTVAHPGKVEKLILIDAAGYPQASKSVPMAFTLAKIPIVNQLATYITPRFMIRESVENVFADKTKVTESLVDRYFALTLREGNRQAFVDRVQPRPSSDHVEMIPTIFQPCLVLWGDQDLLIPLEQAQRFHDDLPNDRLVILKDVGHVPMEESPEESVAVVLDFLKNEKGN